MNADRTLNKMIRAAVEAALVLFVATAGLDYLLTRIHPDGLQGMGAIPFVIFAPFAYIAAMVMSFMCGFVVACDGDRSATALLAMLTPLLQIFLPLFVCYPLLLAAVLLIKGLPWELAVKRVAPRPELEIPDWPDPLEDSWMERRQETA